MSRIYKIMIYKNGNDYTEFESILNLIIKQYPNTELKFLGWAKHGIDFKIVSLDEISYKVRQSQDFIILKETNATPIVRERKIKYFKKYNELILREKQND